MFCIEEVRSNSLEAGDPSPPDGCFGLKFLLLLELKVAKEDRHISELPNLELVNLDDLMTGKVLLIFDSSARVSSS